MSARFGSTESAMFLLELNATADAVREDGATPLMIAAQTGKASTWAPEAVGRRLEWSCSC